MIEQDKPAKTGRPNERHHEHALLAALEDVVAPALFGHKLAGDSVRVWLPDCATGELAYAVAAILYGYAGPRGDPLAIQIFASSDDANAIAFARRGRYPETLAASLPPVYVRNAFDHDQREYRVKATLRELITFAQHDVLRDPPFAHLDLIVCQCLLSALLEDSQEQLVQVFHWCLRPGGFLTLGAQEPSPYLERLFAQHGAAPGLYQRRDMSAKVLPVPRAAPRPENRRDVDERQAVVEHLQAMNQVLLHKVRELQRANDDLNNLMSATDLAIVFLDQRLQITRFTRQAADLFNLIAMDRGRPLADIRHALEYEQLLGDAAEVLASLQSVEREVRRTDGRWYLARLRPYRTNDERIAGVVLICVDISARREAQEALRRAHDELEQRVIERTEALSTSNTRLQIEIAARAELERERTELLRKLVTTQEDERQRIARELHDQLGQSVSALNMWLSTLAASAPAGENLRQTVARLQQIAGQIDEDMERLAMELRPMVLDDVGLIDALQQHIDEWAARSGIAADFQIVEREVGRLPREIETVIFRLIQEALTNVLKHASAGNVSIILELRSDQVRVIVEDDGRGFDLEATQRAANVQRRLGLLGMRERVALVDGTLALETAPGSGTTVFAEIPIPPAGE